MKKSIFIILLLALLLVAAYTNPSKEEYASWFNENIAEKGQNVFEKFLFSWGGKLIAQNFTTKKDFVFFTVYDTKIGEEHVKVVGAFNNFIPIEK